MKRSRPLSLSMRLGIALADQARPCGISRGNRGGIYLRNVFSEMKVTWGLDGPHTSADGLTISNDCTDCHNLLPVQEEKPKILNDLGMQQCVLSVDQSSPR
jgi:hypothetical protein